MKHNVGLALTIVLLLGISLPVSADQGFSIDRPDEGVTIETSVLWPFYPGLFFLGRAALPVAETGEFLVGAQGRIPQFREAEGTFHNLDLHLGWRQHFGLGFHADAMLNVGWGHIEDSTITGLDYDSLDVELMAVAGWRVSWR